MSRLFWVGVGVAAGVFITRKTNAVVQKSTPAGIAAGVVSGLNNVAGAIGSFGAEVRAGMVEKEAELSEITAPEATRPSYSRQRRGRHSAQELLAQAQEKRAR
jgi:chromosome condensin MukBEF MukE localization factor